jgi:hypothetical protein
MDRAEQVRRILTTRDLTLYRVSQQSAEIFGRASRFYIPHNWYSNAAEPSSTPTIEQTLALSRITNYRLYDWLAVFGVDLDQIPRLELVIPRQRTSLLDSVLYDTHAWIPWFVERPKAGPFSPIAPLGHFLAASAPRRAAELLARNKRRFLYGKVGEGDAHALPQLAPGSIVRIDERRLKEVLSEGKSRAEGQMFLIESGAGFTCSLLTFVDQNRIVLHSPRNPCAQTELALGKEARIVGVIDAELRPIRYHPTSRLPQGAAALPKPRTLYLPNLRTNLRELLRISRLRVGLSFREASGMSRWIANTLSDQLYFAAPSTLSDYETLSAPPRYMQKIIMLCVVYCIDFQGLLRASGLPLDQDGREPIPDELVRRQPPSRNQGLQVQGLQVASEIESLQEPSGFLGPLTEQWEEVPLFLRHSLNELTGLRNFSLSDVFWVGGDKEPIHPLLINATFVVINRRVKNPGQSNTACEPPLCLLLKRDGSYLCASCALHQGTLVVRAYRGGRLITQYFKNGIDAEVIGRVTTILRRFL